MTWTQRGTDATSAVHQTASGINVVYSSAVTPVQLYGVG
jgi:hypothetical protein